MGESRSNARARRKRLGYGYLLLLAAVLVLAVILVPMVFNPCGDGKIVFFAPTGTISCVDAGGAL